MGALLEVWLRTAWVALLRARLRSAWVPLLRAWLRLVDGKCAACGCWTAFAHLQGLCGLLEPQACAPKDKAYVMGQQLHQALAARHLL